MEMDEETAREMVGELEAAQWILYALLDQAFGSYKKAPDDHPILKALLHISEVAVGLAAFIEDEDEEAA